ncbi:hypothetical protein [Mastigocladopsis repens]|uniref:hypothetical protein n=1 Tax=Mastigocladopsis repens TaxID=221287 RepID=UPI00031C7746|nr:hypothetical protein [Mastigocladopsis repens]
MLAPCIDLWKEGCQTESPVSISTTTLTVYKSHSKNCSSSQCIVAFPATPYSYRQKGGQLQTKVVLEKDFSQQLNLFAD